MLQPNPDDGNADVVERAGAWTIDGDTPVPLGGGGRPVLLVPAEEVLVLAVDLPLGGRRQRVAALPFAVEDRIAVPTDSVHLALGAAVTPQRFLVGVADRTTMARWTAAADRLGGAAVMPDALALAVPDSGWTVARRGGRTLVRAADATGFAVADSGFAALWHAAGRPTLTEAELRWDGDAVPPLDLRQGAYAARTDVSPWRRLALVAAAGVAAHALIAAADVAALSAIAARWRSETAAQVALARPGMPIVEEELATTAATLVPAAAGGAPSRFLPLLDRASAALAGVPGISLGGVGFDGGRLSLRLDGGDDAPAMAALAAAGLRPRRTGAGIAIGGGA